MLLERVDTFHKLVIGGGTEAAYAYVSHLRAYHVNGIDGFHRDLVACDDKRELVGDATAHDGELHLRAFLSAQTLHDVLAAHLHARDGCVVDRHNAVASQHAHLL